MKVLSSAILPLLSLLHVAGAQTQAISTPPIEDEPAASISAGASLSESSATTDFDLITTAEAANSTPLIEGALGLPVMRDQLTITESAQDVSLNIDSSYGKMMQDFAATLEGDAAAINIGKRGPKRHKLLDIFIGFIIEVVVTLIVLKVAFLMGEFRYRLSQIVPICLAVAFVGALLHYKLNFGILHPIQIGLSSFIMLMLLRLMTEAHEWADALKTTLVARLVTIALTWLAVTGMTVIGL